MYKLLDNLRLLSIFPVKSYCAYMKGAMVVLCRYRCEVMPARMLKAMLPPTQHTRLNIRYAIWVIHYLSHMIVSRTSFFRLTSSMTSYMSRLELCWHCCRAKSYPWERTQATCCKQLVTKICWNSSRWWMIVYVAAVFGFGTRLPTILLSQIDWRCLHPMQTHRVLAWVCSN